MRRQKQVRNVCSFCGGGKLSREHVWPEWAANILPRSSGHTYFKLSQGPNIPPKQEWATDRQGPITNTRLKVVCRDCNSGWMNRQEERARPHLTGLLQGRAVFVDRKIRDAISCWVTMKLMVLDRSPASGRVFLDEELQAFRSTLVPPETLQIWLLACGDGDWRTAYRAMERSASNTPEKPAFHMPNVKLATWGIGELLVVALYQRQVAVRLKLHADAAKKIWPHPELAPFWPPERRLTAGEAEEVANAIRLLDAQKNVRWAQNLD